MQHIVIMIGLAWLAVAGTAAPSRAQTRATQPLYDPAQLPLFRGTLQVFSFTPRGDVDGFVLVDGTEVKTPPHVSGAVVKAFKPGDPVSIHGLKAASLPLIQALSVRNDATGAEVVDDGPPAPGFAKPRPPAEGEATTVALTGRLRLLLHGPRGDVNGALLDDGTILKLPPPEAERLAGLLVPGRILAAEGRRHTLPAGGFVDLTAIGPANGRLQPVAGGPRTSLTQVGARPA